MNGRSQNFSPWRWLAEMLALAAVYFLLAKVSGWLAGVNPGSAVIWPARGVALAWLILRGRHLAPGVFIGSLAMAWDGGVVGLLPWAVALANFSGSLLVASLTIRFAGGIKVFERSRNILRFLGLVAVGSALGATFRLGGTFLSGFASNQDWLADWLTWFLSDHCSTLLFAPLTLVLVAYPRPRWTVRHFGEVLCIGVLLVSFSQLAEGGLLPAVLLDHSEWIAILPLSLAAWRFGHHGTVITTFFILNLIVWGSWQYPDELARESLLRFSLLLQFFVTMISMMALIILAVVVQFQKAQARAEASETRYRLIQDSMLHGLVVQDAAGKIIAMNPAAQEILGWRADEYIGRSSEDEEHHTVRADGSPFPAAEHPSTVALKTGRPVHHVLMGLSNPKQAQLRWIDITAVPIFTPGAATPEAVRSLMMSRKRAA